MLAVSLSVFMGGITTPLYTIFAMKGQLLFYPHINQGSKKVRCIFRIRCNFNLYLDQILHKGIAFLTRTLQSL